MEPEKKPTKVQMIRDVRNFWKKKEDQGKVNTLELADKFEKAREHPDFEVLQAFDNDQVKAYKRLLTLEAQTSKPDSIKVGIYGGIIKYLEDRLSRPKDFFKQAEDIRKDIEKATKERERK